MLADYERVGVVVRGARSTVWKGFDPALKREVALKQLTAEDAAVAARREASVLAGLQHPNIVSVYDVLDDDGVWLIELCHGIPREEGDHHRVWSVRDR